jgi:hypothetical protein
MKIPMPADDHVPEAVAGAAARWWCSRTRNLAQSGTPELADRLGLTESFDRRTGSTT